MNNIDFIVKKNTKKSNLNISRDQVYTYHYSNKTSVFSGITLRDMIEHTNYVSAHHRQSVPIQYQFSHKNIKIADKLTYILTECFFYDLIVNKHRNIRIFFEPENDITTNGIFTSALTHLSVYYDKKKFQESFENVFNVHDRHLRKIFRLSSNVKDEYYLSKVFKEIEMFLNAFNFNDVSIAMLAEVCIELIENSLTHAESDCLIDIDITDIHDKYTGEKKQEGSYYGINIVVLNFSNKILPFDVEKKFKEEDINKNVAEADILKYQSIEKAYEVHQPNFNENYKEAFFWCFAAMQKGISGRSHADIGGGTGLYVLLSALIDKSEMVNCYMITGNSFIAFNSDVLFEKEGFIAFNKEKDFINHMPDEDIMKECAIYMPGTAYNLNFVMKDEGDLQYG